MVTEEQVKEALKTVEDPEIGLDIVTIELVRGIEISGDVVKVVMTLTSPQCPYGPQLMDATKNSVKNLEGVSDCDLELTFTPPWEPSEELRAMLGV